MQRLYSMQRLYIGVCVVISITTTTIIQYQYAMHMVWHNHKISKRYIFCVTFYLIPENISQNANMRQLHDAIANVAKIMFSILCAYRYEIGAIPAIIP